MLRRRKAVERVRTQQFAEDVERGRALIPDRVLERIGPVHFFEGDLHFAGYWHKPHDAYASQYSPLHFRWYGRNADRCCQTVVFTGKSEIKYLQRHAVVHELAHCLQHTLGSYDYTWGWPRYNLIGLPALAKSITRYKDDVYAEQFCEAMVAWLATPGMLRGRYRGSPSRLLENGPELLAFFNELAGWPADRVPRALR